MFHDIMTGEPANTAAPSFQQDGHGFGDLVQFTLSDPPAQQPERKYDGDAGYDLFVSQGVTIPPHQFVDVHTGVSIALPAGVWARIIGRSSTIRQRGLLVVEGVIDNEYTGELLSAVWNLTDLPIRVAAGERLAQLILMPLTVRPWVPVDTLPETARGSSGFGSTGR